MLRGIFIAVLAFGLSAYVNGASVLNGKTAEATPFAVCNINVNGDLADPQPLLIKPGTSEFFNPSSKAGIVELNENQQIELYCSSTGFASPANAGNKIIATCNGGQFTFNSVKYNFNQFQCKAFPDHTARTTGARCYNNGYVVEIGFIVETRFLRIITLCHDTAREETYYAYFQTTPANNGFQTGFPRPSFITGTFFGGKNVDGLYTRTTQRQTIATILGSTTLAEKYIEETSDVFMARGHLAAKADFIYGSQQRATFYFVNAAPQWQKFNALNWVAVEDGSRNLASDRNINLDIYVGTYGTMSLKDASSTWREIFLYVSGTTKQIPVPKIFYRILINKADNSGVVLIGVNNPHLTLDEIKKDYVICTDVSSQIKYITWNKDDISRGYSYACDVNEFAKVVPHNNLSTSKLLV